MAWRLEKEFGNGHLVDWGIHHVDIIRHITGEGMPSSLYSSGGIFQLKDKITTPDTLSTSMTFNTAPLLWQHRLWGIGDADREFNNGIFFHGENGTIFADDSRLIVFERGKEGKKEEISFPGENMQEAHVSNFLEAVRKKDGSLIACKPADAFMSTATVQLAMISYYTGSLVRWDPVRMEIQDNTAAAGLLSRHYRGKYIHP